MGTKRIAWGLVVALLLGGVAGCPSRDKELVDRQLEALKLRFAELEAQERLSKRRAGAAGPSDPYQPGAPPEVRAPDPGAPPPLPVVKLARAPRSPAMDRRGEPPIRLGKGGRMAPPAAPKHQRPLRYARLDEYGNLVDQDGKIVYRAGTDSPPVDTDPDGDDPGPSREWEEDPHVAPSARVDRALAAPRIQDDKRDKGLKPLPAPRLRQLRIDDGTLPLERDGDIVVDTEGGGLPPAGYRDASQAPTAAPPAPVEAPRVPMAPVAPSRRRARRHAKVAPKPAVRVVPAPRSQPARPARAARVTRVAPRPPRAEVLRSAPGPDRAISQRAYKGRRERKANGLYKRAMKRFRGGELDAAAKLFEVFLKRYSDHDLADNALYWLGETAYSRGAWQQAVTWFQDVIIRYPEGNKLGDAMLKSALCYARLGDSSYARKVLSDVETLFPSQPVAEIARKRRAALESGGQ